MKNRDFRQRVLFPRVVTFPQGRELSDPFADFGTQQPVNGAQDITNWLRDAILLFGLALTPNSQA